MSETSIHGPGGELVVRQAATPAAQVIATIRGDDFKQQVAMALPADVTADRFVRATVTALMQNEEIATAAHDTIFRAVIRCAQDGLLPDGREAAIVTFKNKKKNRVEAQYLPMIAGFRKIAAEQGWAIRTQIVYENEEFSVEMGLDPTVRHVPTRPGVERGPMVAAYAVGAHADGRRELEVMYAQDIAKVRASSRASEYGPWRDWEDRMWEKTVGRRLFKKLPLGDLERVHRVLTASDEHEALYGPEQVAIDPGTGEIIELEPNDWHEESGVEGTAQPALEPLPQDAQPAGAPEAPDQHSAGEPSYETGTPLPSPAEPVASAPDLALAQRARKLKPPIGPNQDKTLEWLLAQENPDDELLFLLGKYDAANPFGRMLWALVESERPDLLERVVPSADV